MGRDPHVVLAAILEQTRLLVSQREDAPDLCSVTVAPGAQAVYDYGAESCGGMLWTRLNTANPTSDFPAADGTNMNNCGLTLAYHGEIGLLRPGSLPEMNNLNVIMPDDATLFNESQRQLGDMRDMYDALKIIGSEMDDFVIRSYTPEGPDGGAVGGSWTFVFGEE